VASWPWHNLAQRIIGRQLAQSEELLFAIGAPQRLLTSRAVRFMVRRDDRLSGADVVEDLPIGLGVLQANPVAVWERDRHRAPQR
jgi:hypothetical protein